MIGLLDSENMNEPRLARRWNALKTNEDDGDGVDDCMDAIVGNILRMLEMFSSY